jgi:5'-methylthioadenosine phosphorylase
MRVCIFGGTAAYHLRLADFARAGEPFAVDTPDGRAHFTGLTTASGAQVLFNSRHGQGALERSAAFVNHRANVWAARHLGAEAILSWNGCGALDALLSVGDLLVPHDVLDQTRARTYSCAPDGVRRRAGAGAPTRCRAVRSLRRGASAGVLGRRARRCWRRRRARRTQRARLRPVRVHRRPAPGVARRDRDARGRGRGRWSA